jgi:hypothetical protein
VKIQPKLVGGITYWVFLVISLFYAAVLWSCIAPDKFYHMSYDAPIVTFIPPFTRPWADTINGRLLDYYIWSAWVVYALWFGFVAVAFLLPALIVQLLQRHERMNARWFLDPSFIICCILALSIIYVLSLGPVLCLCDLNPAGRWDDWPRMARIVYSPLHQWTTSFDTAYGQYLLWWINLQYWQHW